MRTKASPWSHHGKLNHALCLLLTTAACGGAAGSSPTATDKPAELDEAPVPDIRVAANDADIRAPLDATPSPDGSRVYYTAVSHAGGEPTPGVFAVPAKGGAVETLALGEPLTAPVNISVSLDGSRLFVADPAAGAVFTLAAEGGTPSPLAGTQGYVPSGLTIAKQGEEYLYFTGRALETGVPGLFRIAAAGGVVEPIVMGAPLSEPAGVVLDSRGDAYVVDAGEGASARVVRVRAGRASVLVAGIGVGFPAGITVTRDDSTLLVSGLDPATRRDVVYFVDSASATVERLSKTVGAFAEPAGLHRAHDADVFAWADSEANTTGTVYVLTP